MIKLSMNQRMTHYSWQIAFGHLKEEGPERIVKLFKLGLKEMPRLEKTFASPLPDESNQAREEIIALFRHIDIEMQKAMHNSPLSQEEFIKEVKKTKNFTPEEWAKLSRIPELIGHHHKELFARYAFNTPKKSTPFFKV